MNQSNVNLYNELKSRLDTLLHKHLFVVNKSVIFDIDGTLYRDDVYEPTEESHKFHAVYKFLQYCNSIYVNVFIITARPSYQQNVDKTVEGLNRLGLKFVKIFFCEPGSNPFVCKKRYRDILHSNGYALVMSIGDNLCDLDKRIEYNYLVKLEKNGECSYKLNP
tara:strand:+ start:434 stop:925 length:492 start_codon:yes stop_codon:yes gene_type:complete